MFLHPRPLAAAAMAFAHVPPVIFGALRGAGASATRVGVTAACGVLLVVGLVAMAGPEMGPVRGVLQHVMEFTASAWILGTAWRRPEAVPAYHTRRKAVCFMCRPGLALVVLVASLAEASAVAQQVADTAFAPPIARPAFARDAGPVVLIDEAHHNFHTSTGRYLPFAELLRRDGFRVQGSSQPFSADALRGASVLVIANALHARDAGAGATWSLPTPPAFTEAEIAAVRTWVESGGSLLLIADHMPMAGAAEAMGKAFGLSWNNGFAMDPTGAAGPFRFTRDGAQRLATHVITEGRGASERITAVASFTGSAFRADAGTTLTPILTLAPGIVSLMPDVAWQFTTGTPRVDVGGWLQGAVRDVGQGRVAAFGEAAMFTAQLAGPQKQPIGMNAPGAAQNAQFLLNVLRWLARVPPR